jgi:UDP-N-acetylmuramoyl-tripeptide--D-alanyl-D-alanine ligase
VSVLWTDEEIGAATGGMVTGPVRAGGVSIDSRTLEPGDLFVALRAGRDGHDYVADAFARGAAAAMVDGMPAGVRERDALVLVEDTLAGLTELGRAGRRRFGGAVVAVTGSVGKTTTKEMLRLCLSQGGAAHAAEASHNNHWGVPLTLARLPVAAPACVVEIGMNHAGEIAPLSRLACPEVAVITTVGAAHVGHLGSFEAVADEKAAIGAGLTPGGTLVLPADAPLLGRLLAANAGKTVVTFGLAEGADARLTGLVEDADGSAVEAVIGGARVAFRLAAPGRHMALNALAALTAVVAAGFDVAAAAGALEGFESGAGRGARQVIGAAGGTALLLDESYNASSASIRAALAVLALQPAARRVVVLGDMRELGVFSAAEHAGLAEAVGASADVVFTCGTEMRALFEALPAGLRGGHAATAEQIAPAVTAEIRDGDAVLVKGSYGMRMRLIVEQLKARPGALPLDQAGDRGAQAPLIAVPPAAGGTAISGVWGPRSPVGSRGRAPGLAC